ncbi:MAG TPA: PA2779 family protein [Acidobacteriaceae bacterium]|jgi:hypothetical protein|nr:PA2779 family protein [Acidobacteriaceae bacterium]
MQLRRTFLALGLAGAAMLSLTPAVFAQQDGHLVSPGQLQQQMDSASAARQQNVATVTQFLSTPTAVHAMKSRGIDPAEVKNAIPNLSNAELASLSARATHAQQEFAAGNLSNNDLLIIILVLVVVILLVAIR